MKTISMLAVLFCGSTVAACNITSGEGDACDDGWWSDGEGGAGGDGSHTTRSTNAAGVPFTTNVATTSTTVATTSTTVAATSTADATGSGQTTSASSGGMACVKSCECPEGETCEGGLCVAPEPEPTPCEVDCDCPSGALCVDGFCG